MKTQRRLAKPVLACLFAALIAAGAYIAIPLPGTPVPIVLQNFFILLAALVLEPLWSLVAVLIYLALGAAGLPVFSGGAGGLARFVGPTGGYLGAYPIAVLLAGLVAHRGKRGAVKDAVALVLASILIYALGVSWLKESLNATWTTAIALGLLPFLPGDVLKIVAAVLLGRRLSRLVEDLTLDGEPGG
ncbi:MAG TPA: biotin transporter BioY [Rectinemataceae bacterium]|nr:biotin transporter BioY [Rectinemataceae bacterium]